jgi:hypothetical protein
VARSPWIWLVLLGCSAGTPAAPAVVSRVTWPEASALDLDLRDRLPADLRAQADAAPVPVLLPRGLDYARAHLVVAPVFYALSAPDAGATVALQASKLAYPRDNVPPQAGNRALRGTRGFVTVNEGIRSASWLENGVAYALDVECADAADTRCADDAYLLGLVEGLGFVGGRR